MTALTSAVLAAVYVPAQARQLGKDGAFTATAANTVVNQYTTLSAAAAAGATTISVASAAGITVGDVLMVYQAQGATISTANTNAYGAVTALGNAGRYEFVSVAAVSGTTITLGTLCDTTPLRFSYSNGAQVIRVPQYSSLTVNAAASIVAQAWNGSTGGVVAAIVDGTATVNGSINANGRGFRGGVLDNATTAAGTDVTAYVATTTADGAEKGESIAGYQAGYDALGGRYNRGAPANGGGGGNSHNAGGGGGANGGSAVGWNGQGVPDTSVAGWVIAWNIDGTLTATTNSPGGGRGGYTYAAANQDALTAQPGSATWGGNSRRERGGLGGRPLANNPSIVGDTRLFFGGGGGAGDGNNGASSSGANGGGLVFLIANAVSGSGALQAGGATATNTVPGHNDSPGGGGGGGSIVLVAPSAGGLSVSAIGGNGGNQLITNNESEGPGGGGGGGFVASPTGAGIVTGGNNGTTSSGAVTEFLPNGATRGNSGNSDTSPSLANLPLCNFAAAANLAVTKTNTPLAGPSDQLADTVDSGTNTIYTLVVTNTGPNAVTGAVVTDTPGSGVTCPPANTVTCTSPAPGVCPAGPLTVADLTAGLTLGSLPATAGSNTATFTFTCTVQ
jgi:uncharacterized repeat protein (TIGR01451 family)